MLTLFCWATPIAVKPAHHAVLQRTRASPVESSAACSRFLGQTAGLLPDVTAVSDAQKPLVKG